MKLKEAIEEAKKKAKKRNFIQSFELAINLRDLDLKKPENRITLYLKLPNGRGKPAKIGAFVNDALYLKAKELCDIVIHEKEFEDISPRKIRKIAKDIDFFISQVDLMTKVAKYFGKYLAGRGKLPDMKYGGIVPPNTNLEPLIKKLRDTIRLIAKKQPVIHTVVGAENMEIDKVVENANFVLNELVKVLPKGKSNIKSIFVKLSMGPAVKVEW